MTQDPNSPETIVDNVADPALTHSDDDGLNPRSVRIDWDALPGQDPSLQHLFIGDWARLNTKSYTDATGQTVTTDSMFVKYWYQQQPFSNSSYPQSGTKLVPDSPVSVQVVKGKAQAVFLAKRYGTTGPLSPDYVPAYVTAQDPRLVIANMTVNPGSLQWASVFEVRIWLQRTAKFQELAGDGGDAKPDHYFQTPLSVKLTDSVGNMLATHGMQVQFLITSGNAEFDPTGSNQRYCMVDRKKMLATVICQHGVAFAPRIKAGSGTGIVVVRASSPFAALDKLFILNITDENATSDPRHVYVNRGGSQDLLVDSTAPIDLQVRADNQFDQPATTGQITFSIYPDVNTGANVSFNGDLNKNFDVTNGIATADPLIARSSHYGSGGYASANIYAFASDYDGNPQTDKSSSVATFGVRVWQSKLAVMTDATDPPNSSQGPGQLFTARLRAKAVDKNGSPVGKLLVTFTLTGSGEFIQFDSVPVVEFAPKQVVVLSSASGLATAPRIRAGTDPGYITVTATSAVSNDVPYKLQVEVPADQRISLGLQDGDLQDQIIGQDYPTLLAVSALDNKGGPANIGSVIFQCAPGQAASGDFAGQPQTAGPVTNGSAFAAEPLTAQAIPDQNTTYTTFQISASSVYADRPVQFQERIWREKHALLSPLPNGDAQHAVENSVFRYPVGVAVKGPSNEAIENLLVTFTLQGPGEFIYDAAVPASGLDTATTAGVYTNSDGEAYSPKIKAGDSADQITINADSMVSPAPQPFTLNVLSASTTVASVYMNGVDYQDKITHASFDFPLTVACKASEGDDATTGKVRFEIRSDSTATASFANVAGSITDVDVADGTAQVHTVIAGTGPTDDYGIVNIWAYPSTTHVPDNPNDGDVVKFTLRVWPDNGVTLTTQGGDQNAQTEDSFETLLTAKATNKHESNAVVEEYLVTFTISGGSAVFEQSELDDTIISLSQNLAVVRTNAQGIATAPRLMTGDDPGPVTVIATDSLGNQSPFPNLTVGANGSHHAYDLKALSPNVYIGVSGSNYASYTLTKVGSTEPVPNVEVTLNLENTAPCNASLDETTDLYQKKVSTNGQGKVSVEVFGRANTGSAVLNASQPQANPNPCPINVQVTN